MSQHDFSHMGCKYKNTDSLLKNYSVQQVIGQLQPHEAIIGTENQILLEWWNGNLNGFRHRVTNVGVNRHVDDRIAIRMIYLMNLTKAGCKNQNRSSVLSHTERRALVFVVLNLGALLSQLMCWIQKLLWNATPSCLVNACVVPTF
jgi:hypothetical protein